MRSNIPAPSLREKTSRPRMLMSIISEGCSSMDKKTILWVAVAFAVSAFSAAQCSAQQAQKKPGAGVIFTSQSGTHWLSWDRNEKQTYVVGFLEGWRDGLMELAIDHAKCDQVAAEKQSVFTAAPVDQLVDSVDKFYSDPINRQVRAPDAVRYVRDQIAGMPASDLEKKLTVIRQRGELNSRATEK
jgi:hypothetical protein